MASTKSNLCDLSMTAGAVVYKYVFLLLLQETQILGQTCVEHNKYRPKRYQVAGFFWTIFRQFNSTGVADF